MSLSNTSANKNRSSSVPSERLWLRSELMGTQVITTDTGRRLGVVGEVVVDIDRREVVALGLSCLLYTSPSPRDRQKSRMPSSA